MKKTNKILLFALGFSMMNISGLYYSNNIHTYAATDTNSSAYEISDAYWDDADNKVIARWEKPDQKTSFKVKLLRNGQKASSTLSVTGLSYNFTKIVSDKGTGSYKFQVYSSKGGTDTMIESDVLQIDSDTLYYIKQANKHNINYQNTTNTTNNTNKNLGPAANISNNNEQKVSDQQANTSIGADTTSDIPPVANIINMKLSNGQIPDLSTAPVGFNFINGKYYFKHANGNMVINDWLYLDNHWYLFDEYGCMVIGWKQHNNKIYNFANSGQMRANTVFEGHTLNDTGAAIN